MARAPERGCRSSMLADEVRLRPAVPDDAEDAGAMHYASFVETYADLADAGFWRRASRERSIENWRTMLSTGVEAMLAEADGSIVGVAITAPAVPRGEVAPLRGLELTNLYVLARHQGSGIGQDLLDAVLPAGAAAQLWVARGNPRAVRFYERNGFTADGAEDDGSAFGGIAALRMVR